MPITKKSYEDLKEYWDYQRKLEYNREKLKASLDSMEGRVFTERGMLSTESMFDHIWTNIGNEDLETPVVDWIPKDEKYRFEWEGEPDNVKKLPKSKPGRPVVLRAKILQDDE